MWRQWHCSTVCNMQNVLRLCVWFVRFFFCSTILYRLCFVFFHSKPHFHSTPVQHSTMLDTIERTFIFTSDVCALHILCWLFSSFCFVSLFLHSISFCLLNACINAILILLELVRLSVSIWPVYNMCTYQMGFVYFSKWWCCTGNRSSNVIGWHHI